MMSFMMTTMMKMVSLFVVGDDAADFLISNWPLESTLCS